MQEYNVDPQINFPGFDPNYPQVKVELDRYWDLLRRRRSLAT